MSWFFMSLGIAQCILLWVVCQTFRTLKRKGMAQRESVRIHPPAHWPHCTLLIPVAAILPRTEKALLSLLQQDYPALSIRTISEQNDSRPEGLVSSLSALFPNLESLHAPVSATCGQKNANLLHGVANVPPETEVLVFCDSTHWARPDFLKCLIYPIAKGECEITTGYHQVIPQDQHLPTLGYTLSVLFMRFLQGVGNLTQPWGGAMAMTTRVFNEKSIAELWQTHVVDDCSLASMLQKEHERVLLCPGALLDTDSKDMNFKSWSEWLTRQILFLKFCIPSQWILLCCVSAAMIIPPVWCAIELGLGLANLASGTGVFMACIWLAISVWFVTSWRRFVPANSSPGRWFLAFITACLLFFACSMRTITASSITWQGNTYHVARGGRLLKIERRSQL